MGDTEVSNMEVFVTNIKRRFTGVSATVNTLVPVQARSLRVGYVGSVLPNLAANGIAPTGFWRAAWASRKRLSDGRARIWHVRRDHEMMAALFLRDVLRLPIKLVFTSAAKHQHGRFPSWLISRMDALVSTTPEAASFVANTSAVVPHGIDTTRFTPPASKGTAWESSGLAGQYGIGVFGRVRPDKGSDIFVDAMLQVLPEFPAFTAVIAGLWQAQHAEFQAALQVKIDAAGLHERCIFLGEVSPDAVVGWYQRVLICVACPRYEPFGLTPLEGMACGAAVVASDTGAFKQVVDENVTGYVVPCDDVPALVAALRRVMANPEHALAMGAAGRARIAQHYSVENEAAGIAGVYARVWAGELGVASFVNKESKRLGADKAVSRENPRGR